MTETHDQIVQAYNTYIAENTDFESRGNKAAGARARKALSDLSKLLTTRRKEIQEIRNTK